MSAKIIKRFAMAVAAGGLLTLIGLGGYRVYRNVRQTHLVNQARQFLTASDVKNASLCLERALRYDPADASACRLMAELAETEHAPSALIWRSRVVELDPDSLDDRLALAETAIRKRDFTTAAGALDGARPADKETAAFHDVSGALAIAQNQPALAEKHFREVARMEPTNVIPLLNLAILALQGSNAPAAAQARTFLRGLASNPTNSALRHRSLRELTVDAMHHHEASAALALSDELLRQTNTVFGDQILRLDVLADSQDAHFEPALAAVQNLAITDTGKVAELASWETTKLPLAEVLSWLTRLPKATQTNQSIAVLMAECYSDTHDWRTLQSFLEPQTWREMDFVRHGFLARSWRGQEMLDTSRIEWDKAVKGAQASRIHLLTLLSLAVRWDWNREQEELLRIIIKQYPADQGAFQALAKTLFLEGRTRSLLELYSDAAKRDPANLPARNNVAFAALLLDAQEYNPRELAHQLYVQAPTNSAVVSTYVLSLLLQKKNAEALRTIESLDPQELNNPTTAGLYGLALQANADREKAKRFLTLASIAPMLPEFRKLITAGSR
jgi:hypothetical protein